MTPLVHPHTRTDPTQYLRFVLVIFCNNFFTIPYYHPVRWITKYKISEHPILYWSRLLRWRIWFTKWSIQFFRILLEYRWQTFDMMSFHKERHELSRSTLHWSVGCFKFSLEDLKVCAMVVHLPWWSIHSGHPHNSLEERISHHDHELFSLSSFRYGAPLHGHGPDERWWNESCGS